MIICRTPFRISFFGGGTDFPAWYRKHGGAVLSTTIDKYCNLTCRYLPPFFEHKVRVVWSKIENCADIEEVEHPAVKAVVKHLEIDRHLEIHHIGDLPARSGMGSSSAFTVGLLNALNALEGKMMTKRDLAELSIHLEQNILKENVGSQDQVCAAHGGFNRIEFQENGEISVAPMTLSRNRLDDLQSHLMLFFTGISRTSSDVAEDFQKNFSKKEKQFSEMRQLVDEATSLLNSETNISEFGKLMRTGWDLKRSFGAQVSNPQVEQLMSLAMSAGALGGKLTGAGGGGFLLLFVPPQKQFQVREALKELLYVPFAFEYSGSRIVFAEEDADYSEEEQLQAVQKIVPFRELEELVKQIPDKFEDEEDDELSK